RIRRRDPLRDPARPPRRGRHQAGPAQRGIQPRPHYPGRLMNDSLLDHPTFARRFTPEHRELREQAQRCFQVSSLREWMAEPGGYLRKSQWEEFGRLGLLGVSLPRELGGRGLGLLGALILSEAASRLGDLGISL